MRSPVTAAAAAQEPGSLRAGVQPVQQPVRDMAAAQAAAAMFLRALGVDCEHESTLGTPGRMARAFAELLSPRPFEVTTFENDENYTQLVVLRGVPFASLCEHHALPFLGTVDVGYLPTERMVGLSKLARVVELFARRPQVQERMTQQIADWLQETLHPAGVGVLVRAEHFCMRLRGVQVTGTSTITSALHGRLLDDSAARDEFLALTRTRDA